MAVFSADSPLAAALPALRPADASDAAEILRLLSDYAQQGLLLPRTLESIYADLPYFVVAGEPGRLMGCASLYLYDARLAEVRSLAVDAAWKGRGLGRRLVEWLREHADRLEIARLFALTFQDGFFEKLGFVRIEKDQLPEKIWHDCIGCAHFPVCKEEAYLLHLRPSRNGG